MRAKYTLLKRRAEGCLSAPVCSHYNFVKISMTGTCEADKNALAERFTKRDRYPSNYNHLSNQDFVNTVRFRNSVGVCYVNADTVQVLPLKI